MPCGSEGIVEDEKDRGGHEHHVAHGGGGGGADVNAVIDESGETGERQQIGPKHVLHGRSDHRLVAGQNTQQPLPAEHEEQREQHRQADTPV